MAGVNGRSQRLLLTLLPVIALSMTWASAPVSGGASDGEPLETYEAFALAMGTSYPPVIPPGTNATVQINITRWTTPEEREMLLTELLENGQRGLVDKLQKQEPTGWVINRSETAATAAARRRAGIAGPSHQLRYAWQIDRGAGNRRIVAALDRPIGFREASQQPRSRDYDLTFIVLDVNEKGEGTGQLALAVKMELEPETKRLVVENYGSEPVRLNQVRRR